MLKIPKRVQKLTRENLAKNLKMEGLQSSNFVILIKLRILDSFDLPFFPF